MLGLLLVAWGLGNRGVRIPAILWGANGSLPYIWAVLAGICILSALFIFSVLKKLEKVSK